ncbi:MAG: DUF4215 domain-containing protein [Acidovorax sp.]|nr:DUF4215 domain-containing protein [Acidovorax sp.]
MYKPRFRPVDMLARAILALRSRSVRTLLAVCGTALLLHATAAHAVTELRTLIDSDGNPGTGCSVATPAGVFPGVDQAAVTRVDLSDPSPVGDVSREICQGGALVADPSFVPLAPLRWPLGVSAAGSLVDVVESYTRLAAPPGAARLAFVASTTDGSLPASGLLSADGSAGGAAIHLPAPLPAVSVPALGSGGLLLVSILLALTTYRFVQVRRLAAAGSALCLLFAVGLAWAAMVRDGSPVDWRGVSPIANAPTTGPLQFSAVYAVAEGSTLHLRYDLDLGVRDGAPLDDGPYATTVGTALPVAAPGLLANDALGAPPMQVREFRLQGAATATPAGGAVAVAGSTLTVGANGGFTLRAPSVPGTFRFEYRAHNGLTPGGWGVATVNVTGAAAVCGDGVVSGGEACDDGNNVTETSCPYGSPNCSVCNATCTAVLSLSGPYCGDGVRNGAEVCDDGNNVTETSCPYGTQNCTVCNATCSATLNLTGDFCGDGRVTGAEVCDDGNNVTETSCPYGSPNCSVCNATCTAVLSLSGPYCGDGVRNGGEACDDGNNVTETSCPYGSPNCSVCNANCTAVLSVSGPYCGDGILNGTEACDDGNSVSGDGCSSACTVE